MTSTATGSVLPSSFRDPSGFLFEHDGILFRQVNTSYREHYDELMRSGLYEELTDAGLLVPHEEVAPTVGSESSPVVASPVVASADAAPGASTEPYKVLRPELVPFVSYPYEWAFSQLKHAALATLRIQKRALQRGMCLKDASAYNIQFRDARPVLIDTLSFERRVEGEPWVAYRQFCQHFLAPLALMAYRDVRLGSLLRAHLDGIPLDLASSLLPLRTRLRPGLFMHLHAHAATQKKYADKGAVPRRARVSSRALQGIVESLESAVRLLRWKPAGTEWAAYYDDTNYSHAARDHKGELVSRFLDATDPRTVWDMGANDGRYSRLASERGIFTVASDVDPAAVELNYRQCRRRKETHLLPLLMDLTNPSPALGWDHSERMSLLARGPADAVLALALIHHLAISNNVPLPRLAAFFTRAGRHLVIEFVPKQDTQVQRLLATREDVFPDYGQEAFEAAFRERFDIEASEPVHDSERTLYRMRAR